MKAIDIVTPADYEVRPYKGGERKAHIVRVEQRDMRIIDPGFFEARTSTQWRAIEEYEYEGQTRTLDYPLGQVIRPWSVAAPEHEAAAVVEDKAERVRATLEAILQELGVEVEVGSGLYLHLTEDAAIRLTDLLRVAGEGRA